jgi:hypothetical protein
MGQLPHLFTNEDWQMQRLISLIAGSIRKGNTYVKDSLIAWLNGGSASAEWIQRFATELEDLADKDAPEVQVFECFESFETIPFLGRFVARENPALAAASNDEALPF